MANTGIILMFKLFCLGFLLIGLHAPPHAEALIGCDLVYGSVSPCLGYIGGGQLSQGCCSGIRSLLGRVNTKPDRQSLCGCLKTLATTYTSRIGRARALLGLCRVRLPFPLDPNIDCSRVN